ncbi:Neurexin-2 [Exaiptasia diaphana]|nr:Neurexin-2 [Exaiptasia diaphana]
MIHATADDSNITRKYKSKDSYSVYDPMSFIKDGSLEIWFKTENENAMILYEDTGGQGDFIDVFLVNGKARMRLAFPGCNQFKERTINGSFNDRKWHKVKITQNGGNTTFAVDNLSAVPVRCLSQIESMVSLYTGCLSWDVRDITIQDNQWAFPTAFYESMLYGY